MAKKYIQILLLVFIFSSIIYSQDKTRLYGSYELRTTYNSMKFIFNEDLSFQYDAFYDVGGRQPTISGNYEMIGDTIKLIFPDSLFENDILGQYDKLKNWQLLWDHYKIYHYIDDEDNFDKNYPLININFTTDSLKKDFNLNQLVKEEIDSTNFICADTLQFKRFSKKISPIVNDWQFCLPYDDTLKVKLYHRSGQFLSEVYSDFLQKGFYALTLTPQRIVSDMYIIIFETNREREINRFVYVK